MDEQTGSSSSPMRSKQPQLGDRHSDERRSVRIEDARATITEAASSIPVDTGTR